MSNTLFYLTLNVLTYFKEKKSVQIKMNAIYFDFHKNLKMLTQFCSIFMPNTKQNAVKKCLLLYYM